MTAARRRRRIDQLRRFIFDIRERAEDFDYAIEQLPKSETTERARLRNEIGAAYQAMSEAQAELKRLGVKLAA